MADKIGSITVKGGGFPSPTRNEENPVPVLCLKGILVFPYTLTPLVIDGADNVQMITRATNENRLIGIFSELPTDDMPGAADNKQQFDAFDFFGTKISRIGVVARIVKMLNFPDGTVRVLVRGIKRVSILKTANEALDSAKCTIVTDVVEPKDDNLETTAMIKNCISQFQEMISYSPNFPEELKIAILNVNDNSRVVDLIADTLNISFVEKLSILTLPSLQERLQLLTILLNREVEVLHLGAEIQSQVHNALSRSQREFFLREQLKTIKKELGEENRNPDVIAIEARLKAVTLPESVQKVVSKELERLEVIPQASAEYHVAYNYIDWLVSVPWNIFSEDRLDLKEATKILDHDHYGLKDIKERILEFLAVLKLKKDRKSPILCFIGPPGVGKTSLGQSIARAMQRQFVRMSLGGIKDEAEIRGHRRTYVGALPGRIIQGLKKSGTANPVFMLDEIDKLGSDYRGDPASAMLEVLDPAQNKTFNDHFLEMDFDLSAVMFIATANISDTIPGPLLDRMEIIHLPGYTGFEKKQIAKHFLIPRQFKENGLKLRQISFADDTIDEIINYYTREAGVRNLERMFGTVCRKLARKIVEGEVKEKTKTVIAAADVNSYLGPRKFLMDEADCKPEIGTATGMAWTSAGGTILQVEVTMMPGKGNLKLTGSLGAVMRESAEAAFSFIRSNSGSLKINDEQFEKNDFHIHVPDGATPKDGPSAGVTMAVALASLLLATPAQPSLAMTGEITLRGRVTQVGGIKEKVIAALRSGVKIVLMPESNRKDLEDIPDYIKDKLTFKFVDKAQDAISYALSSGRKRKK